MTIAEIPAQEKVRHFIEGYADDRYCIRLLRFFGAYPNTRFSRLAIVHAQSMDGGKSFLEKALMRLVDKGVIKSYSENGILLYSLTEDESLRRPVLEIAKLHCCQSS